jgi:hypothetical protein
MKKLTLTLFVFMILAGGFLQAQYVNTLHVSNTDFFNTASAVPSSSGGFLVEYFRMSSGGKPCLARLDTSGNLAWNYEYDISNFYYQMNTFCEVGTGDIVGIGINNQALVYSGYNSLGVPQWYVVRNTSTLSGGAPNGVVCAADGNDAVFIAGGSSTDSVFIGKISSAGVVQYLNSFDLNAFTAGSAFTTSYARALTRTSSGDFVAVLDVYTNTPSTSSQVIVKFSTNGTVIFAKYLTYSSNPSNFYVNDVEEAANGDILVSGTMKLNAQDGAFIYRTDASGNIIWAKHIQNGASTGYITEHSNGDITLGVGLHLLTPDNVSKSAFIRLNSTGNFIWCRNFGAAASNAMYAIDEDANGFTQAIVSNSSYSSQGAVGMVNADMNGNMTGCFDVVSSVPIVSWTPSFTTFTVSQNPVTYSLPNANTITSNAGITFMQSNPGLVTSGVVSSPLCYGGFGNVYLSVSNGTNPYTYTWSNGTGNQNLLNVLAGTYTSRVSDAKGCVALDTFTVTTPPQLAATTLVTNVTCFGAQNGAIDITPTGGTPGYTYQWATQDTTQDLSGLSGGFYQLILTDSNNCTKTIGIAVQEPQQLISGINSSTNITCTGLCNGSLSGIASGGTAPYVYSWNNPGGSTTQSISGLCPGNYLFTVTDAKNCVTFSNGIITEPNPLSVNTSVVPTACGDNDGMAIASATGGVAPFSYLWSNATANDTTSNLAHGTFSVTVTDANSCTATGSAVVDILSVTQDLCMVTVDSANHNVIVWEKPAAGNIAGYNIYRNVVGAYTLIDFVDYDSLSEYTDMTFGVDPNITSYRYKISALDTCGYESDLSTFHQTIHLTSSVGVGGEVNLVWNNYQGFAFSYNRILRDSTLAGNWQLLDSVAATNFTWTDLNPPDTARYLVEVVPGTPCTSTRAVINTSRSNIKSQMAAPAIGIAETSIMNAEVFPNPATEVLNIISPFTGNKVRIEIYDAQGKIVNSSNINSEKFQLSVADFAEGIYFFTITDNNLVKAKGKFLVN